MLRAISLLCLGIVLVCSGTSGEIVKDPTLCGRTKCIASQSQNQKFKYQEGIIYRYKHSINVSTNLGESEDAGNGRNESIIHIDSVVSLHFTTPCEGHLKLSDSSISQNRSQYNPEFPDRAGADFKKHLEKYDLRFAFHDGQIHEICPHPKEAIWVLNLKRGVLSMFQNTMRRFDVDHKVSELDVNGICETQYNLHEAKITSLIIKKTKKIPSCTNRYKHLSVIQSTSYRSPLSPSQPIRQPLLKSWSECEITIDHNIYESVSCKDAHLLQPFSNGDKAGARTDTTASLKLIEESSELPEMDDDFGDDNPTPTKRTNLLYNHASTPKPMHGEMRTSRDLVKNMCRLADGEQLQQQFSETFTKFIHSSRLLDYPTLSQLFNRVNGICKNGRKHILDALPFIGSSASVKVMKDQIMKKQVTKEVANDWVTGFALIPRPDRDTILAMAPLLNFQQDIPESQFVLAYSAVIHAFCVSSEQDCTRFDPVAKLLSHLEAKIKKGCARQHQSPSSIKQTLEAIKAIGNLGVETETLEDELENCIEGGGGYLPMDVRVAAIDAHRRFQSCGKTRDRFFLNLYRNFTQDTELRIASYLQVMRCPDYNVIKIIKHTLKLEEVNQVGSFVWSHLTNLLISSSPTRIEIQSLLTDRDLGTKFNSDIRKFSRNYDQSFFSEEYNFGANYQSNLIFSPNSYIPRSAMLNVTVDLFGESVNALEVGVRLEGMEFYAEKLFGPDGPLSNEKVSHHFRQFLRKFRSTPTKGEEYWKQVKQLPNVIDNNFDHPKISLGYKIFGNELKYVTLTGDIEIKTMLASLDPWAKVKQILSGKEINYEKAAMFLDSTYVVPTTTGLPIRLGVSGSAACNFKMSGSLDSKNLASNSELEILGNITPSVSVDVTGTMIVDGFYKSAGIKLRTGVYSSGAVRSHLNIKGRRLVSLRLGLPNQKMEVFSALTDVLLISSNGAKIEETPVGVLVAGRSEGSLQHHHLPGNTIGNRTCTWSSLDRLIGLKLCTDYQFPNVTKNPNASYFILNGPTLFKVSLIKADPTAKSYLFEYKWETAANQSIIRLAFDTPGSEDKRELSAMVNFNANSRNVTLRLQSAGSIWIAKGTYKRTDNETLIDVGLDINGTKHFDASIGYKRKERNYGFSYEPKLYMAINNERIAELQGTIRNAQKNNVSQCDIDLTFETKKVWSRVLGYVMRRNASLSGDINLEYQLEGASASVPAKKENLNLVVTLNNLSSKSLTYRAATVKLQSSAYPQFNVVMAAWCRQATGHLELHTEVNSSPHLKDDRHKLTAQLVVTYSQAYFQNKGAKISAFVAITKPIQNLDIKLEVNHNSVRDETNSNMLIRYAPGKEIILVVNTVMPRGAMFSVEGHANLTVPNFNSMLIDAHVKEKARREYELDFSGTWFSGHNLTARGTYTDRSTLAIINHTLKLLLKSPSFAKNVILNCKLYHDATDLKVDLQMEQLDDDKYALVLKHTISSPTKFITYMEGRYKNSLYTIMGQIDAEREAKVEMHLDRWRDVHLTARGINEGNKKEAALEIKWDANRDPALKFETAVQLLKSVTPTANDGRPSSKNVSATLTMSYPGRLITGSCLFALRGYNNYVSDLRLDWSPSRALHFTIDMDYNLMQTRVKTFKLESQLLTPFENWKRTSLNARYLQSEAALTASSSAYWQDSHHVLVDFSGNVKENKGAIEWSGNCGLISSVHAIKWVTANLTHKHLSGESEDSHLLIKYHPDKVIDVKSAWRLDRDGQDAYNVTGSVHLVSPLASYKRGDMKCHLQVMPDWKIYGAANLDIDKRKYTGHLQGDVARLKESMLQFNLTTPLEKYAFLRGSFGFSERNKHIVAEIVSPSGPLGLEVLCQLFTAGADFNVKLLIATPIQVLQQALLVAKMNKREADFRIAYNNMTAGFQGVWHYHNITDFHYSYILFTPLQGLQECGVVTKLVVVNTQPLGRLAVDTEFSLRLSETKIGLKAKGGPKPPPVRVPVALQPKAIVENDSEEYSDEEDDDEENLYWRGDLEVDAAIIPTIVGVLDIDEEEETHKILGSLKIPHGMILIDDRFFMEDILNMRNDLSIDTPFACVSEIASTYVLNADMERQIYIMGLDLKFKNESMWIESGLNANYTYQGGEADDPRIHSVKVDVKTPLSILKYIETLAIVEIDENLYKGKLKIKAENCDVDLAGSLEADNGFLDTTVLMKVDSTMITIPRMKITVKKDLTAKENHAELGIEILEPVPKTFKLEGTWHIEGRNFLKASLALETWLEVIKSIRANVLYSNTIKKDKSAKLNLDFKHYPGQEYKFLGDYKDGSVSVDLRSPVQSHERLQFLGKVNEVSEGTYQLDGDLTNAQTSATYKVSGLLKMQDEQISLLESTISPSSQSNSKIVLRLKQERRGFTVQVEGKPLNGSIGIKYNNKFNWNAQVKARTPGRGADRMVDYEFTTFMNTQVDGNLTVYLHGRSPWEGLESLTVNGNMLLTNETGTVQLNHLLNRDSSYLKFAWSLVYMEDMFGRIVTGYKLARGKAKHIDTQIFFKNPRRLYRNVNTGFDVNIDHELWRFGSNVSVGLRDLENVDAILSVRLPSPDNDDHKFLLSYHANKGSVKDASYVVGYTAGKARVNYASDGSIRMGPRDIDGHLRLTWGMHPNQTLNNLFNVTFNKKEMGFNYSLISPKFIREDTVVLSFNYDGSSEDYSILNADLYCPARRRVGTVQISYNSMDNVNGTFNASTPLPNIAYAGCKFDIVSYSVTNGNKGSMTTRKQSKRFIEVYWPNNTALLQSEYTYQNEKTDSSLDGNLLLEIPLSTRHSGHLSYGYKKRPLLTTGHSELTYNGKKIVHGQYNSKSESRAGFEKDRIQITIENEYKPLGVVYTNQYEYSGGNAGTNYPTTEYKHINVYRLDNSSAFNIVGESRVKTTHTGQDIHLKAIHSNRTIQLRADYQILPGEFDQTTWLSLADDAWASYHINVLNKTTEDIENQFLVVSFAYPRRNFTLDGSYKIRDSELTSDAKLEWDRDKERARSIGTAFQWKNLTSPGLDYQQQAILSFKHPSFAKDVTFKGQLTKRDPRDLVNVALIVDYSPDPEKLLELSGLLRDDSRLPANRKYSYEILGKHQSTRLDLGIKGTIHKQAATLLETQNRASYKRSFMPVETGQLHARIDLNQYEIELHRENKEHLRYLKTKYYSRYPEYIVNGSMIKTPDINATGALYLNLRDKLTWMMVNYTPDAVESLRMYGKIPDARNTVFDIWRTYDNDLTISDVAFYLRLNHSRLVTSTLRWRPDLRADVSNTIRTTVNEMYDGASKDLDYWKQYVKSETASAISDIWNDAQPELEEFLDDWNDLKELQQDLDDLKVYLNDSYNANEFYVKDIVAFGVYVVDELSLRSSFQSLPNILNEIWEIMGESGDAIRNSLIWAIETVKSGYNKLSEIISAVLKGDSMSQIANIVEQIVEKYDKFIKDLHVSFIKYIENLWNKISLAASQQWTKFLKLVEPIFIRVIHYLETVVYKASKEVLDFLYDRKNEIITSPYFDRFTKFTQDVDKIYKDIKGNDIITNIRKYSTLAIQFIKERYFTIVPFGKELKDVIDEIINEFTELKKLPSVRYSIDKAEQLYNKAKYLYDYFEVGTKVEMAVRMIHSKLMDISQTALQAENRYREAKTKFIFDPHRGLMCLEQKLPMSWHAFNQTPEFQEIPEYRAIADLRAYFVASNTTFWTLYYQYKPYTEPANWLPPFKAQAMIAGSQHYMTFDGSYFEFSGTCTYLLAQDFLRNEFAVLISYNADQPATHRIIVLIGGNAIQLDVFKDSVSLLDSDVGLQLPAELGKGEVFVYQMESIVTVETRNKMFKLECNLKFDLCTLELSGWYYGRTAGLLGTMNNEQMDDHLTSNGDIVKDVGQFARSWSLSQAQCTSSKNHAVTKATEQKDFCNELFVNKSSEFSSCFNVISPSDYMNMCLNSKTAKEACTVAVAYMQVCAFQNTYLRIPDKCMRCRLMDGSEVAEGEFRKLEGSLVPKSTDVVFIVEAKECNQAIKENRSIEQLVTQLNKELNDQHLTEIRWSLVTFGGDGVYDQPRSLIHDSKVFTPDASHFSNYFERIPVGNGNQDIFAAIGYASQLLFRAGVSKTFILMPCSHCDSRNQTLDYSVLHQVLLEHDITLHILMDGDFQFEKERLGKIFYGLDATKSYTKKDARGLTGDVDLRKQVKLSKSVLGYCTPLSLETNGTIFSGDKLRFDQLSSVKKFASVFAKRVAQSAVPSVCQNCECTADNNGITRMECLPCVYPTPAFVDYGFNEDESLAMLQPMDYEYDQIDMEEE